MLYVILSIRRRKASKVGEDESYLCCLRAKGSYHKLILRPIHRLQQVLQRIEVAWVGIHIEDVAVAVDELVSGEAVHAKLAI